MDKYYLMAAVTAAVLFLCGLVVGEVHSTALLSRMRHERDEAIADGRMMTKAFHDASIQRDALRDKLGTPYPLGEFLRAKPLQPGLFLPLSKFGQFVTDTNGVVYTNVAIRAEGAR